MVQPKRNRPPLKRSKRESILAPGVRIPLGLMFFLEGGVGEDWLIVVVVVFVVVVVVVVAVFFVACVFVLVFLISRCIIYTS